MQNTLAESVIPAQRQHAAQPAAQPVAEPAPALSAAGRDVVVERRRGGLPQYVKGLVLGLDLLVVLSAIALAWPLRGLFPIVQPATSSGISYSISISPLLVALWIGMLAACGTYALRELGSGTREFQAVAKASVFTAFAAFTACYFANSDLARGFLLSAFAIGAPLLLVERYLVRTWIHRNRLRGAMTRRVLAVGSPAAVRDLAEALRREPKLGYELVACTLPEGATDAALPAPPVGSVVDISTTCRKLGIDTVMVTGSTDLTLREVAWDLEGKDIDLVLVPNLAEVAAPRLRMRPQLGLPFLHVEEPRAVRAGGRAKRVFDLVGALAALVLLAPVMILVAALIKLDDGGPVFYRQARVGLNGAIFGVWKFRSMSVNADLLEAKLREQTGHEGALFKMENDPRITGIGRFIRRYSLDELPQLFNVLSGQMSLVGPRPSQPWEADTYTDIARRRLHVLPGMTGLWQVSGRSRLTFEEALRLDLYYRDNWSMLVDLAIMGKTVKAVVSKDGAY
jgi:exopolysaccharide biosynthesis polyprenyl glycosylphosphotransferase